jgi:cell division septal protein FtsQ
VKRGKNKFDLSTKRRKKKSRKVYLYGFLFLLVAGGLAALANAPFLNLSGVQITGTEGSEAERIKSLANALIADKYYKIIPKSNIIVYPRDEIKKETLEKFPSVKNATIKTSLQGELLIEVEKREFKSLWCSTSNKCYLVDQSGLVFAPASGDELQGYLRLEGMIAGDPIGKTYGTPQLYEFFLSLGKQLEDLGLRPEKIKYYTQDKAEAVMGDSRVIFIPDLNQAEELFSNLSLFVNDLKAKKGELPAFEYIDARYGNKIFYKLK